MMLSVLCLCAAPSSQQPTHLAGVEVPDVCPAPAAARVAELREKLVPVLVEITLALGEIFIDERVGAVLVTDVEDGLLGARVLVLVLVLARAPRHGVAVDVADGGLLLAEEAEALGAALGLPWLGPPQLRLGGHAPRASATPPLTIPGADHNQQAAQYTDPALKHSHH